MSSIFRDFFTSSVDFFMYNLYNQVILGYWGINYGKKEGLYYIKRPS
jgi:hypothetical protein